MLAVSPLRSTEDEREGEMETFSNGADGFPDFSVGSLLDSIDFDDLFVGIHDGDVLPDIDMIPELLANFSVSSSGSGEESPEIDASASVDDQVVAADNDDDNKKNVDDNNSWSKNEEEEENKLLSAMGTSSSKGDEMEVSKKDEAESAAVKSSSKEGERAKKRSSQQAKNNGNNPNNNTNNQGKRKAKVDWTPELHRRFVQAVEQLGVDKAVPSRILEIMGIHCLTRHNIASHLQKYRSHRRHMMAREVEAASWSQKRGVAAGGGSKANMQPWHAPTMGFPPMTLMHRSPLVPLHVWGHPPMDQSTMAVWPKQLVPPPSPLLPPPLPPWASPLPHPPPADPSFWHSHHHRVPTALAPTATPCIPQQALTPTRFVAPPVPGIPPHAIYRPNHGTGGALMPTSPQPPLDIHPTKESVDAAIGEALSKPWSPLPIGLKPPSVDSVLAELQHQGIPKIPPTTPTS
ncbi:hypothetical protein Nepgr_000401 [Nepenthes gracilis]|uniref:HTH myb-type domain-containing protein n=1 Tax=Nepenthes gracilis TaxID=150966 RepID=A0AAD3RVF5_NEPGR|nr:hypothetical protein Nepgr_000401 [Nepenthes gracilis]